MYCPYKNTEVDSCPDCGCNGCSYYPYSNPDGLTYPYSQQFNYECPDCHGKFNYANYTIITEINYGITGCPKSIRYAYVCPFCGKEMKGLK
jgi:hypothetical protein